MLVGTRLGRLSTAAVVMIPTDTGGAVANNGVAMDFALSLTVTLATTLAIRGGSEGFLGLSSSLLNR
eukprot:16436828-Heterocapsa_arctica.AAC.1